ncbi:hypothetical protein KY336_04855 [Candidatus Woesearchaeota archaeon]|nr:hypothetical protein [Candidatus Woesearchaeota archaeon]
MKIEIDTNRDSKEDIKKIIRMLTHLVGEHIMFDKAIHSYQEECKRDDDKGPKEMVNLNFLDNAPSSSEKKDEKKPKIEFF